MEKDSIIAFEESLVITKNAIYKKGKGVQLMEEHYRRK